MNPRDVTPEEVSRRTGVAVERITELEASNSKKDQETLALLKIITLGRQQVERGETKPAEEVLERLRAKYNLS